MNEQVNISIFGKMWLTLVKHYTTANDLLMHVSLYINLIMKM